MAVDRRAVLGGLGGLLGVGLLGRLLARGYAPKPRVAAGTTRVVESYGTLDRQRGEWWLPPDAPAGRLRTVVLVHGGYWRDGYDLHLEDAVAADLAGRGLLVWNIDYRPSSQLWPATLSDAAAAYDHLGGGRFADRVGEVSVMGHSAGGHLALWLGSRDHLPAGAPGHRPTGVPVPSMVVAQAPVADLRRGSAQGLGGGAVDALLGGAPDVVPDRVAAADPVSLVPAGCPVVLVHGSQDDVVPLEQSRRYLAAAQRAGGRCSLETFAGGHFEHLDPRSEALRLARSALGVT